MRAPGGGGRSPHVRLASGSAQGGQAGQRQQHQHQPEKVLDQYIGVARAWRVDSWRIAASALPVGRPPACLKGQA